MKSTIVPAMGKCIFGALLLTICISMTACDLSKVDNFDKPNAFETFQGMVEVDFAIKDTYPKALATDIVQAHSSKDGKTVTFAGLPPAQPYFYIIPEKAFDELKKHQPLKSYVTDVTPAPMVSGLVGKVITPTRVEIIGFPDGENRLVKLLGVEVTGTVTISGGMLTILDQDPITIWVKVRNLKKMLPAYFLDAISDIETGKPILEVYDDDQKIPFYTIRGSLHPMTFAQ